MRYYSDKRQQDFISFFFPADVLAPAVVRGTLVLVGEEDGGEPVFLDAVVGEELEPQAVPLRGYHLRWDRVIKKRKRTFFARLDLIRKESICMLLYCLITLPDRHYMLHIGSVTLYFRRLG